MRRWMVGGMAICLLSSPAVAEVSAIEQDAYRAFMLIAMALRCTGAGTQVITEDEANKASRRIWVDTLGSTTWERLYAIKGSAYQDTLLLDNGKFTQKACHMAGQYVNIVLGHDPIK